MGLLKRLVNKKQIERQRKPIKDIIERAKDNKKSIKEEWIKTGIAGLDNLLTKGIPRGTSILVAGGAGSGKTILCLQILSNAAKKGKRALYISLEEPKFRLMEHMKGFGWKPEELERKNLLRIKRVDPFRISRSVEAFLAKEKGELKMRFDGIEELVPAGFKPDLIVIDSLTALAAAFKDEEVTYRIYVEQLFRYLERLEATAFLVSETEQIPVKYSRTGVEEFLADGVIVLYNMKHGNIRENAIEILKLRGVKHKKKIVAMQISAEGVIVYPEQEVFSDAG